jgi:hypothetical protein
MNGTDAPVNLGVQPFEQGHEFPLTYGHVPSRSPPIDAV